MGRTPVSKKPLDAAHAWAFAKRFRRRGFGWRSSVAVPAVRKAIVEIKRVARTDPVLAAEGAVRFLERVSPALEQVDGSSGAIGSAVAGAIDDFATIVGTAPLDRSQRGRLLERLSVALNDDGIGYLDAMESSWGAYCGSPEAASAWVDGCVRTVSEHLREQRDGYLTGTIACLSALFTAARYDELLSILEYDRLHFWSYRKWGFKALVALGRPAEALRYAEAARGINDRRSVDAACERLLLDRGMEEEAYRRYGMSAVPQLTTNLAVFRAMRKKYPHIDAASLLHDLVASTPGREGRWFASAVHAELYDVAFQLAQTSPADPKTLTRAGRDRIETDPSFSLAAAELALESFRLGLGYDVTSADVIAAYRLGAAAATQLGSADAFQRRIVDLAASADRFMRTSLEFAMSTAPNEPNTARTEPTGSPTASA
ncbi:MAG: hypothetical protein NVS3B7_19120 [Candidatus Elarobacter sp.]